MILQFETAWAIPWYTTMVIVNVVALVYCAVVYKRSLIPRDGKDLTYRKWMRIMGVIFTVVSAYRAISVWAIPYTFRIPNTLAEVSMSGLFAYAMLRFNTYLPATDDARASKFKSFITKTPYILVGCIVIAQPLDTWDNISNFVIGGTIMETLWGIGFLSVLPLAIIQLRRVLSIKDKEEAERLRIMKYSSIIIVTWCVVYVMYRWIFTLPGMWARSFAQIEAGLPPLNTGLQAIIDMLGISIRTSLEYSDWGFSFLIWHSAYFSILTWITIFLMKAPRPQEISGKRNTKQTLITLTLIAIGLITLITLIGLPADIDEIITLIILGGIFLVPIAYFVVWEIKSVRSE
ncbi:MAG: hypothetical protein ACTSO8_06675 [Promethearchaeota archaeon]